MRLITVALAVSMLAACNGMMTQPPKVATVKMFKSFGTVQCEPKSVNTGDYVAQLEKAGVPVYGSSCGVDGMMRPAVCGAGDGRIVIVDVAADRAAQAQALGYESISKVPDYQVTACK